MPDNAQSGDSQDNVTSVALKEAAQIATRSYASAHEAIQAIMSVIYKVLDMRTLFVAHFELPSEVENVEDGYVLNVHEVQNHNGCALEPGTRLPLVHSY